MKKIYILFIIVAVSSSACKKGPYTCICVEHTPVNGPQQYSVEGDYDKAAVQCDNFARSLNSSSSNYECVLD